MQNSIPLKSFLLSLFLNLPLLLFSQGETCSEALAVTAGQFMADGPSSGGGATNPPATNADWYLFQPAEGGLITITSCGGGADTRLWVYTGSCVNLQAITASDDQCDQDNIPDTNNDFASRIVNLQVEAGQTYYIEWDNRWDQDGFTWTLDFLAVGSDVTIHSGLPFTLLPDEIIAEGVPLSATVFSLGSQAISNVSLTAAVFEEEDPVTPLASFTGPVTNSLPSGAQAELTAGVWSPESNGDYLIRYTVDGLDDELENNEWTSPLRITAVTYAKDDGQSLGGLGIPGPGTMVLGQEYDFYFEDEIASVSAWIEGGGSGDSLQIAFYSMNGEEQIGELVATSDILLLPAPGPGWVHFFLEESFPISAGETYMIALKHYARGDNIAFGVTDEVYERSNTWIQINEGVWQHLDDLQFGFRVALMLRLNNGIGQHRIEATVDMADEALAGTVNLAYEKLSDSTPVFVQANNNGDGTWTATFFANSLDTIGYYFINGSAGDGEPEAVPEECGHPTPLVESARILSVGFEDWELPLVCFGSCELCPPGNCSEPDLLICDDVESYEPGPVSPQSLVWTPWPGGMDALVTQEQASSGLQSVKIDGSIAGQDMLFLLGDRTSGRYQLSWQQFVPSGKLAYFNIQHNQFGGNWAYHLNFFENGSGNLIIGNIDTEEAVVFNFPQNEWFEVRQIFDLDQDSAYLFIETTSLYAWKFSRGDPADLKRLGSVNFFPEDASVVYYLDDLFFRALDPVSGTIIRKELAGRFELFPNPASDQIMLRYELQQAAILKFTVFDALGRQMADQRTQAARFGQLSLDLSSFSTGMYYLRLSDGQRLKTIRFIRKGNNRR